MSRIAIRLKPDHVCSKYTLKNLFSPTQAPGKLAAWEWNVKKEANIYAGKLLSKYSGKQRQMITMDPDDISGLIDLNDLVSKLSVHLIVIRPPISFGSSISRPMLL